MDVKAAPASGGNPNQIREYERLSGRVFDVRFSPDGTRAFAGASLDGKGQVRCYETESGKVLWTIDVPEAAIYALACSPDGSTLATAGSDGQIRLIDTAAGSMRSSFPAGRHRSWSSGSRPTGRLPRNRLRTLPRIRLAPAAPRVRRSWRPSRPAS